jgi:hypothetical protein
MYIHAVLTNIDIDEDLIAQAMKVSGAKTKREVVDRALRDLVARANRPRLRDVFGLGGIWDDYDPKGEPGEPPGKHRVEQPIAGYKVQPAPAARPRRTRKN